MLRVELVLFFFFFFGVHYDWLTTLPPPRVLGRVAGLSRIPIFIYPPAVRFWVGEKCAQLGRFASGEMNPYLGLYPGTAKGKKTKSGIPLPSQLGKSGT